MRENVERISGLQVDLTSHHYIVLSQLHAWMARAGVPVARGVLLDYGCGGQPYRCLFTPRIERYIGADVAAAKGISLDIQFEPGQSLPLPDESVDTILSTQTLEHVYDFDAYLRECARLLRQTGNLIISVPMQWRQHESPFDYWRFTSHGLTAKLEEHGFVVATIEPCGGVYALLGQIFLSHQAETGRLRPRLTRWINRLSLWLDRRIPDTEDTLLWMCVARKT